jgi:lipoprotein-anchoring transpeptidase ErfK/SrfK
VWTSAQAPAAKPRAQAAEAKPSTEAPAESRQTAAVNQTATAQIMLDRAGFSPGEIDGRAGANLQRAVSAFEKANNLPVSGRLTPETLALLAERTAGAAPLVSYTITAEDVAGPFVEKIPADLMEQSKLKSLGYTSPLEALGEKFHVSPAFLRQLNAGATFARAGEEIMVPNVEVAAVEPAGRGRRGATPVGTSGQAAGRTGGARRGGAAAAPPAENFTIYVTKATSALTVEDAAGTVIFHAPVTSGSEHDPLPIGEWKVTTVQRMPVFNYNPDLFWDADPTHAKARIPAGPNNPVGTVWIDLSKEHYGIHGTPEPSRVGHAQSHGCVRLTNWDAQRVMQWARAGTQVIFR